MPRIVKDGLHSPVLWQKVEQVVVAKDAHCWRKPVDFSSAFQLCTELCEMREMYAGVMTNKSWQILL